jgi:uncharacterized membrane protein YoaK (UPF0700 family)
MPLFYLRRLTGRQRTHPANRQLAWYLAFVAGAINAGGFLAVHQYTSHMSGIVSSMAGNLVLDNINVVLTALAAFLSFMLGAAITSLMMQVARRRALHSEYALPLLVEAALLIAFAFTGHVFEDPTIGSAEIKATMMLLCFTMGLQNAMITKLSGAVIRTTHITGMITDIGIELGHLFDTLINRAQTHTVVAWDKVRLLTSLIAFFFLGGVVGAFGFRRLGFLFSLPFAALLLLLAVVPVIDDLRSDDHRGKGRP